MGISPKLHQQRRQEFNNWYWIICLRARKVWSRHLYNARTLRIVCGKTHWLRFILKAIYHRYLTLWRSTFQPARTCVWRTFQAKYLFWSNTVLVLRWFYVVLVLCQCWFNELLIKVTKNILLSIGLGILISKSLFLPFQWIFEMCTSSEIAYAVGVYLTSRSSIIATQRKFRQHLEKREDPLRNVILWCCE